MVPYSFTPTPNHHYEFRTPFRIWTAIASAILLALAVACSGAAPTPTPTATLTPTPTADTTPMPATLGRQGLLVRQPESFEGYTLYARGSVYLIDHMGQLVHQWNTGSDLAKLLDNGNLLTGDNREIDPEGNVVWEYSRLPQHHDLLKLPNGNVLFLSNVHAEALAIGANPDNISCPFLRATSIVEVRPTGPADGEVVWRWSALDHLIQDFDPEKPNYGVVADHPERIDVNFNLARTKCFGTRRAAYVHANALDYNADLDQIMITIRNFSEIWIIDHSTSIEEAAGRAGGNSGKGGDILYRWGNPRAYQRGTADDQRLFFPHNAHWIPEGSPGAGNVLIFNNGAGFDGEERRYSTLDEIALPAHGYGYRLVDGSAYGPNELAWRYAADPPESFYAVRRSGAQRLPNGATLIADSPSHRIFEVSREGGTVWEFAATGELFRAYRYAPNHPGIMRLLGFYRTAYRAAAAGSPVALSVFTLYLLDDNLVYAKERCDQEDAQDQFFLHIVPERTDDLPPDRREFGFDNLDFAFFLRGALFDGRCVAMVPLPDYPISSVRTGQHISGVKELWSADFAVGGDAQGH